MLFLMCSYVTPMIASSSLKDETNDNASKATAHPVYISKAVFMENLSLFEETGRLSSYEFKDFKDDSPFGNYIARDAISHQQVGICGFSAYEECGVFYASHSIDVLKHARGKGYGTRLLQEATKSVAQHFGKQLDCTYTGAPRSLSILPLTQIISSTEWDFGDNHASLKMHVNAGYGILGLDYSGSVVKMAYPPTIPGIWDSEKQALFIKLSHHIAHAGDIKIDHVDASKTPEVLIHLQMFLRKLDLTQEKEILTLALLKKEAPLVIGAATHSVFLDYLKNLSDADKERIKILSEGKRIKDHEQLFPLDRFHVPNFEAFKALVAEF